MRQVKFIINFIFFCIITVFCLELGVMNSLAAKTFTDHVPLNFTDLSEKVKPGVVNIRTVKTVKRGGELFRFFGRGPFNKDDPFSDFFNRPYGNNDSRNFIQRSLGSGFIIDKEGYIVTNNHVIEGADKITVVLENGKEFKAKIVGHDPYTDIALIKIVTDVEITSMPLGDSDLLNVGQWVIAVGNPFGLSHTVTAGIVSAKGRIIGSGPYDDFIQTDASINPGNSGGPLLNMSGEVVGINTMIIAGGQGIGFAIPVNLAKGVIRQLKEKGDVTRGWLGVTIQDLKDEIAEYYGIKGEKGALILAVVPGDPADEAGIRSNDIIIGVNGKKVSSGRDLTTMIAGIGVGEIANIKVIRNGKKKIFKVKIARRPDAHASLKQTHKKPGDASDLGLRVSEITPQIAQQFGLSESGVIVTNVMQGSKAEKGGILQGDIIKGINRMCISDVNDFKQSLKNIKKGKLVKFLIKRMRGGLIVIQIKK